MKLFATVLAASAAATASASFMRDSVAPKDVDASYWWKFSGSDCSYDDVSPQPACGPKNKGNVAGLQSCCSATTGCGGYVQHAQHGAHLGFFRASTVSIVLLLLCCLVMVRVSFRLVVPASTQTASSRRPTVFLMLMLASLATFTSSRTSLNRSCPTFQQSGRCHRPSRTAPRLWPSLVPLRSSLLPAPARHLQKPSHGTKPSRSHTSAAPVM